jgi:mono/diheme cytochrome c family protein
MERAAPPAVLLKERTNATAGDTEFDPIICRACRSARGWRPAAGATYAKQYCAKCHAIADEDASPEHAAPRFKDVANTSGMTATALTVWLQTSHPTMPNIILEPNDMSNVVAYILSLKD